MESILVKLPNWMGDVLFSYDLLYSLTRSFERVAVLGSHHHMTLLRIFPLPSVHALEHKNWPAMEGETVDAIRDFQPEWGLLLPNSIGSAWSLRQAGVKRLAGYRTEHRGFLLKKAMDVPSRRMHQNEYYLQLVELFGVPVSRYPVERANNSGSSFILLHPGASKKPREWSLERFLQLADALSGVGKEVMFVSGVDLGELPYPCAIKPSLYEFAGLLKRCALFIGNDSGPLHLAQQCGAPVVGIYGPGDPFITGPRPITPSRVVYHSFPCSPCRQRFFEECEPAASGKPMCLETISTQEVLRASLEMLEKHPSTKN